jgi:hypothetical protein
MLNLLNSNVIIGILIILSFWRVKKYYKYVRRSVDRLDIVLKRLHNELKLIYEDEKIINSHVKFFTKDKDMVGEGCMQKGLTEWQAEE